MSFGKAYTAPTVNWTKKEGGGGGIHPFFVQGSTRTLLRVPLLENPGRTESVVRSLSMVPHVDDVVVSTASGLVVLCSSRRISKQDLDRALAPHGYTLIEGEFAS